MSQKHLPAGSAVFASLEEEGAARMAILALVYRYAALAHENVPPLELAALFEPGAKIKFSDGSERPPSEIREVIRHMPEQLTHHVTTVDIQFVAPNEARCQAHVLASTNVKSPDHWGRWDSYVKRQEDGKWLFSIKVITMEGMAPGGWVSGIWESLQSTK
ncbi:hypothetical protein TGAM01_v209002 [Trichoderma gamsii]|uniref:SnoaL-like domain-containing protein n=1 Tax=Trichoderma gamsii TaxID=398673 RepID=A0A2P4ZCV5_9HYPO|nr:hypothetical protein TGAM01_v209002 [Trichoderma gamsii]PON22128.1 hypothetical protein TGAM01_v209002 [Trichoderma gamsii]